MNTALQNKVENRIIEAQIFEQKALDGRISKATRLHYLEVAKEARDESTKLMNELMGWTD
tara:strand:- start:466 stop:645 length:180 start_codon:yes stop_codon:yes gene_type:complete